MLGEPGLVVEVGEDPFGRGCDLRDGFPVASHRWGSFSRATRPLGGATRFRRAPVAKASILPRVAARMRCNAPLQLETLAGLIVPPGPGARDSHMPTILPTGRTVIGRMVEVTAPTRSPSALGYRASNANSAAS